jgi:hypothetical protein
MSMWHWRTEEPRGARLASLKKEQAKKERKGVPDEAIN